MGFPEKPIDGQTFDRWGRKSYDWMKYVEDNLFLTLLYKDATIKQDLTVEGNLSWGELEPQDLHVWKDAIIQDDATVKGDLYVDGKTEIGSDCTVKGNLHVEGYTSFVKIKTGTYTGDGGTSQAIIGVGFQPKFVKIWWDPGSEGEACIDETVDTVTSGHSWKHYADHSSYNHRLFDNKIISLDSDGFTVDDDGANSHPNSNNVTYRYMALG